MSKTILGQYTDFVQSRKDKLVNMLISEIIFLKTRFKSAENKEEISYLKIALDKLDYLLNKLKENSLEIPEKDFDKITMMIYHIFKEIAIKLE
ncbi:MAG: hypothetical protein ACFFDY_11995 [Candidatus Thorarchaeota archaeon]